MKKTYTSKKQAKFNSKLKRKQKAPEGQFKGLASTYTSEVDCDIVTITSPAKQADLRRIIDIFPGSSAKQQMQRLLTALARYRLTTFEAMRYLDVYHCPARVLQLRKRGYKIKTHWEWVQTESGDSHEVGCYVLDSTGGQPVPPAPKVKPKMPTQMKLQLEAVPEMAEA
jgi:hypothetical protein